ncbi:MAG: ester cyclase [Leptospira bouyouniensis]
MNHRESIEFILKELFTNPKTTAISDVFSSDYIAHTSKRNYTGIKIVSNWIKNLNQFLSDLKITKLEFIYEDPQMIVWKRTIKGKIKPNKSNKLNKGKSIKWEEMIVSKFQGNKIQEEWITSEFLGALLPLGK